LFALDSSNWYVPLPGSLWLVREGARRVDSKREIKSEERILILAVHKSKETKM
jgi:hypothetical protein